MKIALQLVCGFMVGSAALALGQADDQPAIPPPPERPPSGPHKMITVEPGEDLYSIAMVWEVSVPELQRLNQLSGTDLVPGQKLYIPLTAPEQAAAVNRDVPDPHARLHVASFEIYPLAPGAGAEMVEAMQTLAGEGGRVIHDKPHGRLLVYALPERHREIRAFLAKAALPVRNIRVDVAFRKHETGRQAGAKVEGEGEIVIRDGKTSSDVTLRPDVVLESSQRSQLTQQSLLLRDGSSASITVAREMPYLDWFIDYGRTCGLAVPQTGVKEAGAFLKVEARVAGDGQQVIMKLTPEISVETAEGSSLLSFTRLATEVTVQDGQTLSIGGLSENREFLDKFLIGVDSGGSRSVMDITVTPRIVEPAAPRP